MATKITGYVLAWDADDKRPYVAVTLATGRTIRVPVSSADELAALAAVLKESPAYWHGSGVFSNDDQNPFV